MTTLDVLAGYTDAVTVLAVVLVEAVVLYVAYGLLAGAANPLIERVLGRP